MATPPYQGKGQPLADGGSGWLGRLGSFFGFGGGGTPAYGGKGQPSPGNGGWFGGSTPPYATASSIGTSQGNVPDLPPAACTVDSDALAAGQIAIVIPRQVTQ